jgi:hypothetical protein
MDENNTTANLPCDCRTLGFDKERGCQRGVCRKRAHRANSRHAKVK